MVDIIRTKLIIYKDHNGKEPLIEWIESLSDITTKARVKNRIRRLEIGNLGDSRSLGGGLFELKMHFGSGWRVYFGNLGGELILLICGGSKSSQQKDIFKARTYWEDYKEEYGKNKNI